MKIMVITGAGRGFCSGANLATTDMNKSESIGSNTSYNLRHHFNPMIMQIYNSNKIIIAQVNGIAAGAGFSLAMACDFRVCSKSSSFLSAFIRIGLVPDCGLSYFLPKVVGTTRAKEIMTLGDVISSNKALEWGIANSVVEDNLLDETVKILANKVLNGPLQTQGYTKRLINNPGTSSLLLALEEETKFQQSAVTSSEFQDRVKRFTKPKSKL